MQQGIGFEPTDFGGALALLRAGKAVRRKRWGTGSRLCLIPGSKINVEAGRPLAAHLPIGESVEYQPHIDVYTWCPVRKVWDMEPWQPDTTALLADDWVEVE